MPLFNFEVNPILNLRITRFLVIFITWAEDIMADNSLSPREQPEDKCYYRHNIRGNAL